MTSAVEPGGARFYRVQTQTDAGILRSASLTLHGDDYRPVRASFDFKGESTLDVSEQPIDPSGRLPPVVPSAPAKILETTASPEDELRVFEALNRIGTDTEDPIDVKLDADRHQVKVTGMGLSDARQREVKTALAGVANISVHFSSAQPPASNRETAAETPREAEENSLVFRNKLRDRAGSERQLQAIADGAINTANSLFARAHSVQVLAQQFPPPVEAQLSSSGDTTLLMLRQRHIGAMEYALRQLQEELKPLMEADSLTAVGPGNESGVPWQSDAPDLYETTRNLDGPVSRLLSGTYSEKAGEEMLNELPATLLKTESLIRAQTVAGTK